MTVAAWLPGTFWLVYALSNSIFTAPPALGPLTAVNVQYLLMLPAAAMLALRWRRGRMPELTIYAAFVLWVLASMLWHRAAPGMEVPKRLLIYALFGLAAAQVVADRRAAAIFIGSLGLTAIGLSGWTIWEAFSHQFSVRAGVPTNPDNLSMLIAPGLLAGIAWYAAGAARPKSMIATVFFCGYAVLLLASRGVLLAMVPAVGLIWYRLRPRAARVVPALAGLVVLVVLTRLPYGVSCARFPRECLDQQQINSIQGVVDRIESVLPGHGPARGGVAAVVIPAAHSAPVEPAAAPAPAPSVGAAEPVHGPPAKAVPADHTAKPPAAMPAHAAPTSLPREFPRPGAPRLSDVGTGQYEDDLRYYRLEWLQMDGDKVVRQSEPGPAVPFTPSGKGSAVRIERPAPPDQGETHWAYQASADGTIWNELNVVPIGREAVDDTWAVAAYPSVRQRVLLFGRIGDSSTVSLRIKLWRAGLASLGSGARALLVGSGMGASQIIATRVDPIYDSMHNAFLQMAIDFGLLGLALFLAFHWRVLWALWSDGDALATALFAGVIMWLGSGLTTTVTDMHPFWLCGGVAAGWAVASRRSASAPPAT